MCALSSASACATLVVAARTSASACSSWSLKIGGVEHEKRLALADAIAVLDQPPRNLAVHPETEVALGARPDGRGEAAGLRDALVLDGGDQDRPRRASARLPALCRI